MSAVRWRFWSVWWWNSRNSDLLVENAPKSRFLLQTEHGRQDIFVDSWSWVSWRPSSWRKDSWLSFVGRTTRQFVLLEHTCWRTKNRPKRANWSLFETFWNHDILQTEGYGAPLLLCSECIPARVLWEALRPRSRLRRPPEPRGQTSQLSTPNHFSPCTVRRTVAPPPPHIALYSSSINSSFSGQQTPWTGEIFWNRIGCPVCKMFTVPDVPPCVILFDIPSQR